MFLEQMLRVFVASAGAQMIESGADMMRETLHGRGGVDPEYARHLQGLVVQLAKEEMGFIAFIRQYGLEQEFNHLAGHGALARLEHDAAQLVSTQQRLR